MHGAVDMCITNNPFLNLPDTGKGKCFSIFDAKPMIGGRITAGCFCICRCWNKAPAMFKATAPKRCCSDLVVARVVPSRRFEPIAGLLALVWRQENQNFKRSAYSHSIPRSIAIVDQLKQAPPCVFVGAALVG